MARKLGLLLAAGVGYVLGSKAGRERYEQIKNVAGNIRQHPVVSKPLDKAAQNVSEAVRRQGEAITDSMAEAVKSRLFGVSPNQQPTNKAEYIDVEIEEVVEADGTTKTPKANKRTWW
ncbi:hypothetical protein BK816_08710 [Boudabousia tangfeifanii]|uniref:Protoporphyrinogen oxidase n=1 Tax=Boudabousia tangfeifanii TaxID=1912795 RepID=A0A1D9MLT7_9ACTO|nr:hypothetical protein [Boudabousia tangfeifanii]AOZ73341.1 hypothetical protein BK816_08710 [Boudabousia tangfeifanii]